MVPFSVDRASGAPPGMWSVKTFDKWTGDVEGSQTSDRIIMSGPRTVIAEWKLDNTPGIINGGILAGIAGIGALVYIKTHKKANLEAKISKLKPESFEKFFSLRSSKEPTPSFYKKPKKNIIDWLLGRES